MKRHGYNWKTRRNELIADGSTSREIQNALQREFKIYQSIKDIEAQQKKAQTHENVRTEKTITTIDAVKELLPPKGLKSREISKILEQEYNITISKRDVYRVLSTDSTFSYSPIYFTWTQREDKQKLKVNLREIALAEFKKFTKKLRIEIEAKLVEAKSGFPILDQAIIHVVRDNVITENEWKFLENLSKKAGYTGNLRELVNKNLNSHNPYLDSLIHGAFNDGIIEDYEIHTIAEESTSIGFNELFITRRFWCIAIAEYFHDLLRIPEFVNFLTTCCMLRRQGMELSPLDILVESASLNVNSEFHATLKKVATNLERRLNRPLGEIENLIATITPETMGPDDKNPSSKSIQEVQGERPELQIFTRFIEVLHEEKEKLGDPIANLLVENVLFQMDKEA